MRNNNKGQVFVQDLIIAIVIMSMLILIYFSFYSNQNLNSESIEQNIIFEARTITDYLTTSGYPNNWNSSSVVRIGITDNNYVLRKDKLEIFSNMSREEYDKVRSLLKTKFDFLIFFVDHEGNILNITNQYFIGKSGVNITNIESVEHPTHLSKINRFIVVKDGDINTTAKIIEMVTYVWSKEK